MFKVIPARYVHFRVVKEAIQKTRVTAEPELHELL
jgi:hypothetical protein